MTAEEYWEWRAGKARRMRLEEFVLYLAVLAAIAMIGLAVVLFS